MAKQQIPLLSLQDCGPYT